MDRTRPIHEQRELRRKIVELSEYMNHPYCPPHVKKELEERINRLRESAYGKT